jgi:NADPH:quinone reductase-like Zn-dependent oxidoreductase
LPRRETTLSPWERAVFPDFWGSGDLGPISGKRVELLAEAAASGGTIFEYGALAPEPTPFPLFTALPKGLSVRGYTLREVFSDPKLRARAQQYVFDQVEAGNFKPRIDRVFPLVEIVEAHRYME